MYNANIDDFPCASLVTTPSREIVFANNYFSDVLKWDLHALIGCKIEILFTRSSQLFSESYIVPMVLRDGECNEVQIYLKLPCDQRVPMVANARLMQDGNVAWVFIGAENRNKLFHELEEARQTLEDQKVELALLSRTDSLTGAHNRRSFDEIIARAFADADRSGLPVTVLLIDVDHFKSINDTYGHQLGDDVLAALGLILRSVCRDVDTVARYGGDEFVILLNNTAPGSAIVLCDRIHRIVAERMEDICSCTLSIGVSGRVGSQSVLCAAVLDQADKALYEAKSAGRNTTAIRDPRRSGLARSG